ncbi:hypothetical protein CMI37_05335 [Candidatus Pacearchaeota archaeon]|nr:hypothetical protein [Candidatus Pacearchaeota archaeon]|tara:strand:+ start:2444 stop:2719 length:276 start_codon:yes stop_codon:yes gene_type:complete
MTDKIKVKPVEGTDFKEVEITTKNWNLDTRKFIMSAFRKGTSEKNGYWMFDAYCDILDVATTLSEEEIFNLSKDEIEVIALKIAEEINKKK